MEVDVIIPSNAKDNRFHEMTKSCIKSLHDSCGNSLRFNILIYEQNRDILYEDAQTIHYDFEFNYNGIMNHGIQNTNNQYIVMSNNDMMFERYWFEHMYEAFKVGYLSLSPYDRRSLPQKNIPTGNHVIEGYGVAKTLLGWCIVIDRKIIDTIGKLDESCAFWYSDNLYSAQLQYHNIPHGLVCNSFADHLTSQTIFSEKRDVQIKYSSALTRTYEQALKKYRHA